MRSSGRFYLTSTAWDSQPFARDLGRDGPPFAWDEARRASLCADLDAIHAHLSGLTHTEWTDSLTTSPSCETTRPADTASTRRSASAWRRSTTGRSSRHRQAEP